MSPPLPPEKRPLRCARCRKQPVDAAFRPFCSKRCADADLGHWLTGSYVIPGPPAEDADETSSGRPSQDDADER